MPTNLEFLYFDLGNVLFHFDNARAFRQIAQVAELPVGDVMSFFDEPHQIALETGRTTFEAVHRKFCQTFQVSPDIHAMARASCDIFEINAEMIPLVTRLAQSNWRMGILSNTSALHWEFLSRGRYRILDVCFELAALSYQIQSMKPDLTIYQIAAEMAGVPPARIFFTDDRADNVEAAKAAGWQAVQFIDAPSLEEDLRGRGVFFN